MIEIDDQGLVNLLSATVKQAQLDLRKRQMKCTDLDVKSAQQFLTYLGVPVEGNNVKQSKRPAQAGK